MAEKKSDYRELVKEVRRQLGVSQEDLARELGLSFATINRWENGQVQPSRLARNHLRAFCERLEHEGRIKLENDWSKECPAKDHNREV